MCSVLSIQTCFRHSTTNNLYCTPRFRGYTLVNGLLNHIYKGIPYPIYKGIPLQAGLGQLCNPPVRFTNKSMEYGHMHTKELLYLLHYTTNEEVKHNKSQKSMVYYPRWASPVKEWNMGICTPKSYCIYCIH